MVAGHAEHNLRREPVAELRVDVVGADHAFGESGPGVRLLVRPVHAAEDRHRVRTASVDGLAEGSGGGVERLGPGGLDQLAGPPHERHPDSAASLCTQSRPYRPLSQSQPWFTGSEIDGEEAHETVRRQFQ